MQTISNLPPAERELLKQKLEAITIDRDSINDSELTLAKRQAFLRKPIADRFDEQQFWEEHTYLGRRFHQAKLDRYREIFDKYLSGEIYAC